MNLRGLTMQELTEEMLALHQPKFRAKQLFQWIHQHRVVNFSDMLNVSKELRASIDAAHTLTQLTITERHLSQDGTEKLTMTLEDKSVIEAVIIPDKKRITLCVSSQAGCPLNCSFCKTGHLGFLRNLTVAEIVGQVYAAQKIVEKQERRITNIVYMGMGEPLLNTGNVIKSIQILTDDFGQNFSNRKITVSTAGIADQLHQLGSETGVNLAISLHAATNELRDKIMPINKQFPLEVLMKAIREYPAHKRKKTVLEYILLKGINDSAADAKKLAKITHQLDAKVNLIPFNSFEGTSFEASSEEVVLAFQKLLVDKHITAIIRTARGDESSAACGQLGVLSHKKS
ncbi:23S rRNA (adenine(2503)-C(2))-methyltransferase RlmN [bacterium]|nr:23S rRNA (adenine(2503)-C(2))-methyltransferase RlmN [bacterium]